MEQNAWYKIFSTKPLAPMGPTDKNIIGFLLKIINSGVISCDIVRPGGANGFVENYYEICILGHRRCAIIFST
jgi:hypothetical protein